MFSDVHTDFILNPLTEVLADGVNACTSLSVGIENSALGEYFMQSLFLRMTGAQEQKMKCICWVMATNDYRYRYDLVNVKQYGECSEYKHKKGIYADLLNLIKGFDKKFIPLDVLVNARSRLTRWVWVEYGRGVSKVSVETGCSAGNTATC